MRCRSDSQPLDEIEQLRARWAAEYRDGARCGFLQTFEGERGKGGYPRGFGDWTLNRRNAWFSGYNRGFHDRMRVSEEAR
jgi:hypothetical protein